MVIDTFFLTSIPHSGVVLFRSHILFVVHVQLKGCFSISDSNEYIGYLPAEVLSEGVKTGKFVQGFLQVNKSNASQEAFIKKSRYDLSSYSK